MHKSANMPAMAGQGSRQGNMCRLLECPGPGGQWLSGQRPEQNIPFPSTSIVCTLFSVNKRKVTTSSVKVKWCCSVLCWGRTWRGPRPTRWGTPSSRRWGMRPGWRCRRRSWSGWRTTTCPPPSGSRWPWHDRRRLPGCGDDCCCCCWLTTMSGFVLSNIIMVGFLPV